MSEIKEILSNREKITAAAQLELDTLSTACVKDLLKSNTSDGIALIMNDYVPKWTRIWARPGVNLDYYEFITLINAKVKAYSDLQHDGLTALKASLPLSNSSIQY